MGYNGAKNYMDNQTFKHNWFRKTMMVFAFVIMAGFCQAQKWSDMTYWLSTEKGAKQLAELAHPTDTYMRHSVVSTTSDYIIIEIKFEGIIRTYWCKYKVYKGIYDGDIWFKDIDVLNEGTRPRSFYFLEIATDISSEFDDAPDEVDKVLRYFHNCSWYSALGDYRAALILTSYFYDDYD